MNPLIVAKSLRSSLSILEINFNRLMKRELVPLQSKILSIETSSLCNLECVFCAYVKKHSPKISMTDAFFEDCVQQAVDFGFCRFDLTPCTGDAFMDRHFLKKLQFLEDHPGVETYSFFTNFTIPKPSQIAQLARLKKLRELTISIYGHDMASFIAITKSTEVVYRRLVGNLQTLLPLVGTGNFILAIGLRSTRDMPRIPASELMDMIRRFAALGVPVRPSHVYNNWGGFVTQSDVVGLQIDITGADTIYKRGACSHLFTTLQVMATGIVNGCACRDVDATLRIGDLHETPLRDILSPDNAIYMRLIDEQQRGAFRPVCQSCDYYKSIYHQRSSHRAAGAKMQTIDEYKDGLRAAGAVAASSACTRQAKDAAESEPQRSAAASSPALS